MKSTITTLWLILAFVGMSVSSLWADSVGFWTGSQRADHSAGYSDSGTDGTGSSVGGFSGVISTGAKSTVTLGGSGVRYSTGGEGSYSGVLRPWCNLAPTLNPDPNTLGAWVYIVYGTRGTDASSVAPSSVYSVVTTGCTTPTASTGFFHKNGQSPNAWAAICTVTATTLTPNIRFQWLSGTTSRTYLDSFKMVQVTCDQLAKPTGILPCFIGGTSVTVQGCAAFATVYVWDTATTPWTQIGTTTTTTAGSYTVTVSPPLINNEVIAATQVIGGVETCHNGTAPTTTVGVDCTLTAKPTAISGAWIDNPNPVTVSGVLASATLVSIYDGTTATLLASQTFTGGSTPSSVDFDMTGLLVAGHTLYATQTAPQTSGSVESCVAGAPSTVVLALKCQATPALPQSSAIDGPLAAGQTTVTVVGVDANATEVKVYANSSTVIGDATGLATPHATTVIVPLTTPLVKGDTIGANQVKGGIESCTQNSSAGPKVGGGSNAKVGVALDLYAVTGANTVVVGGTTWFAGSTSLPAPSTVLTPSVGWQTVTWALNDPAISMNWVLGPSSVPFTMNTSGGVVLEGIWLTVDPSDTSDTGPYNIYIDNIKNGTYSSLDFEAIADGAVPAVDPMSLPNSSLHRGAGLNTPPNVSMVTSVNTDVGARCNQLNYQFFNSGINGICPSMTTVASWNRTVDPTQPLSMRILVLPVGCTTAALSISQPAPKALVSAQADSITMVPTTSNYGGTAALTYQWKKNGVSITDAGDITGTTSATLNFASPVCGDAGTYTCAVTDTLTGCTPVGTYDPSGIYTSECNPIVVTFTKGPQTITFGAFPAPKNYGDADFDPGATASSGLPVTYSSSDPTTATIVGGLVHIVNGGAVDITASQGGDCNTNAATAVINRLQVNPANSVTTVATSGTPSAPGDLVTFTATVAKDPLVGAAATTPSGTVEWLIDGLDKGSATLDGSGHAIYATSTLTAGTHTVEADYNADVDFRYNTSIGTLAGGQTVASSSGPCSALSTNLAIVDLNDGHNSIRLDFQGTPNAIYYVVASSDVTRGMGSWSLLPWSTNTAAAGTGLWSCIVTNSASQQFYRAKAVNPCP